MSFRRHGTWKEQGIDAWNIYLLLTGRWRCWWKATCRSWERWWQLRGGRPGLGLTPHYTGIPFEFFHSGLRDHIDHFYLWIWFQRIRNEIFSALIHFILSVLYPYFRWRLFFTGPVLFRVGAPQGSNRNFYSYAYSDRFDLNIFSLFLWQVLRGAPFQCCTACSPKVWSSNELGFLILHRKHRHFLFEVWKMTIPSLPCSSEIVSPDQWCATCSFWVKESIFFRMFVNIIEAGLVSRTSPEFFTLLAR